MLSTENSLTTVTVDAQKDYHIKSESEPDWSPPPQPTSPMRNTPPPRARQTPPPPRRRTTPRYRPPGRRVSSGVRTSQSSLLVLSHLPVSLWPTDYVQFSNIIFILFFKTNLQPLQLPPPPLPQAQVSLSIW